MDTSDYFYGSSVRPELLKSLGGEAAGYRRMTERAATKPGDEERRSPAVRQKQEGLKRRLLGPYALQQRFSLD